MDNCTGSGAEFEPQGGLLMCTKCSLMRELERHVETGEIGEEDRVVYLFPVHKPEKVVNKEMKLTPRGRSAGRRGPRRG